MRPVLLALTFAGLLALASRYLAAAPYDPLAVLRSPRPADINAEAGVPPMCYTKTAGANPCWVCHVEPVPPNHRYDRRLQEEYAFSEYALTNRWTNLFRDRRAEVEATSDADILDYIRQDNYGPLRAALSRRQGYRGYVPDLDFSKGFDEDGFARDGSGWRALRFKPFPGTFWPSNGSSDDVFIRLPPVFRREYKTNLDILEAAVARPPGKSTILRQVYAGTDVKVVERRYPAGTEFLHTVRYLDPDEPTLLSRRMKEVRYSRKFEFPDDWALIRHYDREDDEKDRGRLPWFVGSPEEGFRNRLGWLYQGYIEDARGRLRVQTTEEHRTCMGCHTGLGVTVDSTFSFPRKVPGREGWRPQDLRGMRDVPQHGHAEPEVWAYFKRAGAGDELRANAELLARYFKDGSPDARAYAAAPDLAALLAPSRERALALNKAYRLIVREQSFAKGRDPVIAPAANVHREIRNGRTELAEFGRVYTDGSLWLDWK